MLRLTRICSLEITDENLCRLPLGGAVFCRFPRYICTRTDKGVEDASSPDVVVDLYNKQTRKMSSAREMLEAQKKTDAAHDSAREVGAPEVDEANDDGGGGHDEDTRSEGGSAQEIGHSDA